MGKRGHSEEEILRVLREAESGETADGQGVFPRCEAVRNLERDQSPESGAADTGGWGIGADTGEATGICALRPRHVFQDEWVYNEAAIDSARVVWARDLGPAENQKLMRYYAGRVAMLLEPDFPEPRLSPYGAGQALLREDTQLR